MVRSPANLDAAGVLYDNAYDLDALTHVFAQNSSGWSQSTTFSVSDIFFKSPRTAGLANQAICLPRCRRSAMPPTSRKTARPATTATPPRVYLMNSERTSRSRPTLCPPPAGALSAAQWMRPHGFGASSSVLLDCAGGDRRGGCHAHSGGALRPAAAAASGGSAVTLTGTSFTGATAVKFGYGFRPAHGGKPQADYRHGYRLAVRYGRRYRHHPLWLQRRQRGRPLHLRRVAHRHQPGPQFWPHLQAEPM